MNKLFSRSFVVLVAVLCVLELCMRLFMTDTFDGRFEYGFSPNAGFYESPDGMLELRRTGGRKFWPQRFPVRKKDKALRIITIGDSIARGRSLDESYPVLFGKALEQQLGRPVESWNLSVPGYGAERKRIVLDRVLRYKPDLVILHVGMSNEFEDERDRFYYEQFMGWHPRQWPMKSYLVRWLHEFQQQRLIQKLLPQEVRITTALNDAADEGLASSDPARVAAWKAAFEHHTRSSLGVLRAAGIPTIIVPRVVLGLEGATASDEGLYATLTPLLQTEPVVDLAGKALGTSLANLFSGDRVHLTTEGHRRVATILQTDEGSKRAVQAALMRQ